MHIQETVHNHYIVCDHRAIAVHGNLKDRLKKRMPLVRIKNGDWHKMMQEEKVRNLGTLLRYKGTLIDGADWFLRFGAIPPAGHSYDHAHKRYVVGTSAYRVVDGQVKNQGRGWTKFIRQGRNPMRIDGQVVGIGPDNEALIFPEKVEIFTGTVIFDGQEVELKLRGE